MAGRITDLTAIPVVDRAANVLEIVDVAGNASYKVTPNNLLGLTSAPVGVSETQTLTGKTLTSPTINSPIFGGTITGTYTFAGTPTFPASLATLTGTQTLTNKTLTSPTITAPTITNASITADAISGFTTANSGTIYGIPVTASQIPTSAFAANAVSGVLLNVAESTDFISGTVLVANTWTDFKGNQNFTTTTTNSTIVIFINASTICGGSNTSTMATRIVVDSAGTSVIKNLGGAPSTGAGFTNPFTIGMAVVTALSAGIHTIKSQVLSTAVNSVYCRAGTIPSSEFYTTTIIELKK